MAEQMDRMKVSFSIPKNGSMELNVTVGEVQFKESISYTPNDFVFELATALSLALQGVNGAAVAHCEPTTYVLSFSSVPDDAEWCFQIIQYSDWQRRPSSGSTVLSLQAACHDLVVPFWRALRRVEGMLNPAEYRAAMGLDFPSSCMARLSQLLSKPRP